MYIEKYENAPCIWVYKDAFAIKDFISKFEKETQRTWAYITWSKSITGDGPEKADNEYRTSVESNFSELLKNEINEDLKGLSEDALALFYDIDKCIWDYREAFDLQLKAAEPFNLLKYENNAQYHAHHDHGSINERILSLVACFGAGDEGGELEFPYFDLKIKLETNSLVLFPSNFPYTHIAHPVVSGTKYSLVTWFT
jgi:hypothetical protein